MFTEIFADIKVAKTICEISSDILTANGLVPYLKGIL